MNDLTQLDGVGPKLAEALAEAGFDSIEVIAEQHTTGLQDVDGIGGKKSWDIVVQARDIVGIDKHGEPVDDETDDESTTFDFESEPSETDSPDVYVKDRFTNKYGDDRLELAGDTYDVFKKAGMDDVLDWDQTHHKFNKPTSTWLIDADAAEYFAETLAEHGFTFDDGERDDGDDESPLQALHTALREGDRITVTYHQKNGNGTNSKSGVVVDLTHTGGYDEMPQVEFKRDDGQWMAVKFDKFGKVGLYTGGSTNPFVGAVESVTVGRDIPQVDETEDTTDETEAVESEPETTDESPLSGFGTTSLAEEALKEVQEGQ